MEKVVVGKDGKPLKAARRVQFEANRPSVNEHGETGKLGKQVGLLEKNKSKPTSFASILQNNTFKKTVKLQEL
nr:hypothetical protein [Tanacetum cinerariifolium]